jgi:hypothetical protein
MHVVAVNTNGSIQKTVQANNIFVQSTIKKKAAGKSTMAKQG